MKIHAVSPTRYLSLYWEFIIAALRAIFVGPATYGAKRTAQVHLKEVVGTQFVLALYLYI